MVIFVILKQLDMHTMHGQVNIKTTALQTPKTADMEEYLSRLGNW